MSDLKQRCIILYSNPYRIQDEKTGIINEGISINYLTTESLTPCVEGTSKGLRPCKAALTMDKLEKIKEVPAIYDIILTMSADAKGKVTLKPKDVEYVSLYGEKANK